MKLNWRGDTSKLSRKAGVVIAVIALAGAVSIARVSAAARNVSHSATCPAALVPHLGDTTGVEAAARKFGLQQTPRRFLVGLLSTSPYSLGTDAVWRRIARDRCGARVASRSWVAFYFSPARAKTSADLAEGVVYFAKGDQGWKQWFIYR